MTAKHTPGPWRLVDDPEEGKPAQCIRTKAWDIATAWGGYSAAEADARLIAAAPDPLAALLVAELASEELCQGQDPANECWITLATIRAAIAKAKGGAQ
jgi:hypothetical protein